MDKDIQEMKETKGEDSYVYIPFSISLTFLNPHFFIPFSTGILITFLKLISLSLFLRHFNSFPFHISLSLFYKPFNNFP